MKRTLFLSILIVFFTTSFLSIVGCNNHKTTKTKDKLQEKCEKWCKEYFNKENGSGTINDKEQSESISYQSHYNKKTNKCFIILNEHGFKKSNKTSYKMKSLFNMNEKKKYGFFYNIGKSTICNVLENKCKSEQEWDFLVKSYMEE